jgi:hypothetical protein
MAGRESEYTRGFIRGVSSLMTLVASGEVKRLDKTNILEYAKKIVEEHRED